MSATTDKWKGNWNQVKGKLKEKYADLTDNDLLYAEGKEDQLVGRLQERLVGVGALGSCALCPARQGDAVERRSAVGLAVAVVAGSGSGCGRGRAWPRSAAGP